MILRFPLDSFYSALNPGDVVDYYGVFHKVVSNCLEEDEEGMLVCAFQMEETFPVPTPLLRVSKREITFDI